MNSPRVPAFLSQRVFAILRAPTGQTLLDALDVIVQSGIRSAEITLTTPGAVDAIETARARYGDEVQIGAGTVLDAAGVKLVSDAGATFAVSPVVDLEMIEACVAVGIHAVPGTATPTEMLTAHRAGATACKVFPSRPDGPSFIRQILAPLPQLSLVPTGGVALEEIPAYLEAGATAVGLGGALIRDALTGGDLNGLAARCRQTIAAGQ